MILILIPLFLFSFTEEQIEEFERQSYEQIGNDRSLRAIYEGDTDELEDVFSEDNLAILNAHELRLLRNMIYAQHAYSFRSKDLREWFSKFDWYEPLTNDVSDYLTLVDSINIERIKLFESAHKQAQPLDIADDDLVGIWHISPMVAAGYGELIFFFPDHKFKITANQMDWGNRLSSVSGTWSIKMNKLILEVTEKNILKGGEIVEPYASCASEFAIEGGTAEIMILSPSETRIYPISEIFDDDLGGALGEDVSMPRITIGTTNFWQFYTDPYFDTR